MTSATPPKTDVRHTPLYALHTALGARMVPFAGYSMPVQYPAGLMAEHHHTRTQASLFDVSHMGHIRVAGTNAAQALEALLPIDLLGLPVDHQRYALLLNEAGGILDDLMVVHRAADDYLLVVNAATKEADLAWLQQHLPAHCTAQALPDMALLALQGPTAGALLPTLLPATASLLFMQGTPIHWQGAAGYATRSGYTGEDGFEISIPATHVESLAQALLTLPGVQPAGLGARNSLRLEAGLCLYGSDMDAGTTPTQAALNWSIPKVRRTGGARAGGFTGAPVVLPQIDGAQPVSLVRVALRALERVPVRDGTPLHLPGATEATGSVTSGLLSPTLNQAIAMAQVPPAHATIGTRWDAMVRGKPVPMEVVALPFVPTRYRKNEAHLGPVPLPHRLPCE